MQVILDDLSTGLSLYFNFQKQLDQYYKDIELLVLALRIKEGDDLRNIQGLTARQRSILELMSLGKTNKNIASKLGFSEATIHAESSESGGHQLDVNACEYQIQYKLSGVAQDQLLYFDIVFLIAGTAFITALHTPAPPWIAPGTIVRLLFPLTALTALSKFFES